MLIINLLALAYLLLNLIRRALLTFTPSQSALAWWGSAVNFNDVGQTFLSAIPLPFQFWIKRYLAYFLCLYLASQALQGLLPIPIVVLGLFGTILLLLACIDWFYFLLPNPLTLLLMVTGAFSSIFLFGVEPMNIILRCTACYGVLCAVQGVYYSLRHKAGLGSGDVKLITALACWFDLYQLSFLILFASMIALPFCLLQYRGLRSLLAVVIPFGTFLSLSAIYSAYLFHRDFLMLF
ncbi:prepilin peptidase [Rosenbergiella epipactidis]|uniref:prepilin peptidase n=1 Tax=Rosenbergiella epipactidis TaxID=1544694 RepID=UPI0020262992|nr:prepilin peptidase [Rosenbergiella epipactidis]MCL9669567.1 prepilin peptidase [Rosenbergiella epipactidis]